MLKLGSILSTFVFVQRIEIDIVGSGNMASHLAQIFISHSIKIHNIYSRNTENAKEIASKYAINQALSIEEIGQKANIVFLAVSDDAIVQISDKLKNQKGIVVHCSGIANTQILKNSSTDFGCFYPLQSFTKNHKVNFEDIPILITASNNKTERRLQSLANRISKKVYLINDDKRHKMHLAAVFVNNFTNHLFTLSSQFLEENNLDFDILKPLIRETINNITDEHPINNQTGPAKRNDSNTIQKHLKLMDNNDLIEIYQIMTRSIYKTHNE